MFLAIVATSFISFLLGMIFADWLESRRIKESARAGGFAKVDVPHCPVCNGPAEDYAHCPFVCDRCGYVFNDECK